jgi:dihydroorotate dehydrogenase
MDAERAHRLALRALRLGLGGRATGDDDPALRIEAFGHQFRNPIGLAAGFDKDAVAVDALARLGFGFVETGTVTPLPQAGNPRPRLFRLEQDQGVINRMGFNNAGLAAYLPRIAARPRTDTIVGANVGINKEGADPVRDYPTLVAAVAPHVDYVVLNLSSPNTPALRDLQGEEPLRAILRAIAAAAPARPPLLVKIAPDLTPAGLQAVVQTCMAEGVQGLIVSNTTVSRPPGLGSPNAAEAGGLSGRPLRRLSTRVLAHAHLLARGRLTLIGCGGVASGDDVLEKVRAGASLVQLYTAFGFQGPLLIPRLKAELVAALRWAGFARLQDAIGTGAERIAGNPDCSI